MIDYSWVQMALLLQMVLWMLLYNVQVELGRRVQVLFYLGGVATLIAINVYQPHIGFFTPWLLTQYTIYVMASVTVLKTRFNFRQALCLGFLVVYLNSFYWEFFYHVYEFQMWLPQSLGITWWYLRIPQWLRVVPAVFLLQNFEVRDWRWIALGLVIGFALTYANFVLHWRQVLLLPAHRVICLAMLVYTVMISQTRGAVTN